MLLLSSRSSALGGDEKTRGHAIFLPFHSPYFVSYIRTFNSFAFPSRLSRVRDDAYPLIVASVTSDRLCANEFAPLSLSLSVSLSLSLSLSLCLSLRFPDDPRSYTAEKFPGESGNSRARSKSLSPRALTVNREEVF